MTKEIIIDGVNVAGCEYLNKVVNEEPYCNMDEEHLYTCSSDENCYFKQLKRLEQENAELKQTLQEIKAIAEIAFLLCDDDCGNANKFQEIIKLTKAEEE